MRRASEPKRNTSGMEHAGGVDQVVHAHLGLDHGNWPRPVGLNRRSAEDQRDHAFAPELINRADTAPGGSCLVDHLCQTDDAFGPRPLLGVDSVLFLLHAFGLAGAFIALAAEGSRAHAAATHRAGRTRHPTA